MSGQPPRRPPPPPRPFSIDNASLRSSTPPELPRSHSPIGSNGSTSPPTRKPVPKLEVEQPHRAPSPNQSNSSAPRPTNPNPFAVKPELGKRAYSANRTLHRPAESTDSADEYGVLNFGRRPSAVDPLASAHTGPPSRQLVAAGLPSPTRASHQAAHQAAAAAAAAQAAAHSRKPSHSRKKSISLQNNATNGAINGDEPSAYPGTSPSSADLSTVHQGAKILPLQPAPTRTRAPMEAFASVEMLQGQKEHQNRTRGTEIFGKNGQYEGRASVSNASGEPGFNLARRQDPTETVRAARGPGRAVQIMPQHAEVDAAGIAHQLRIHDAGRGSEEPKSPVWQRSFSGTSDEGDNEPAGDFTRAKDFSFPSRKPAPVYTPDDASGDAYSEKSIFGDVFSSKERLSGAGGWRTEHLGGSEKAFQMQRPSIVALPVYPSPSGTLGRSFKLKAKRVAGQLTWLTAILSQTSAWIYLWKRWEAMSIVESRIPNAFVGGWCFLALETLVAFIMTVSSFWAVFTRRPSEAPKMRLRGDSNLPAVDVFIVSSGQSDRITFDCAVAAASMDYPPHRYRVMVLDPTGSADLQRDINQHAKSQACPHLSYHRRALNADGSDLFYTKANSVNFGMQEANSFGVKGPAEFIAVFDADMIPERNYLRAMLPSILGADKVGLVKASHGFINLPQRLTQPKSTLMTAAETPSDCRSGFLARRAALTDIGGFPSDSWIQDGHCEALLKGRGYKVAVVDEVLQWSMARSTYGSQINSMMINRLGPLRTAVRLGFFIRGDKIKMMSFGSRLHALGRAFSPILSLLALVLATVYPFMFSYGGILVLSPDLANLRILLVVTLVMVTLSRLHELVWSWSTGQPSPRRAFQAWIFGAPYQGVAILRMLLPVWLGGYARGSDLDINAASSTQRPPFIKRLGWLVIDPHTGMLVAFLSSVGVAIWRIVRDYERGTVDDHQSALTALLTVAWPSLLWLDFVFASVVPFSCLLFPSRLLTEPRESFLIRDHYTSVARPKHSYKTAMPFKVHRQAELLTGFVLLTWAIVAVCLAYGTHLFA